MHRNEIKGSPMASGHDQYANEYDQQVRDFGCYLAEVLFGLSYEYIRKGDTILDVGIGTGISSGLFHSAGLQVSGIDGSAEMLKICREKGFAKQLTEQDLLIFPWPYQEDSFNHVTCCGVLHFLGDLDGIFKEISRIQKTAGVLSFTVMDGKGEQGTQGNYTSHLEDGFDIFCHQASYMDKLIQDNGYSKEKEILCFVGQAQFRAIIARKG